MQPTFISGIQRILGDQAAWRSQWPPFKPDDSLAVDQERLHAALDALRERLKDNYPFFHPLYAGQMLKPPHEVAVLGYIAAMLINPNNHALDGGPATAAMEKEVVAAFADIFGFRTPLGHLTSSGTIANLEALWIARELHPGQAVAFSSQSHYTHRRMCQVLNLPAVEVPADDSGRMDMTALKKLCLSENIGTVVATIGSTGLGAMDPLPEILALRAPAGFRIHIDAAYGGFYRLVAGHDGLDAAVFDAMAACDSLVVDPHKHGLQPYGCGCVLFSDPSVGRFYAHDSPYTYFTSDELHLGEISIECSRAGAAAAALWTTMQCVPFEPDRGLGRILQRCRQAALRWADLLRTSSVLNLLLEPELDIVTYFPTPEEPTASAVTAASDRVFRHAMSAARDPVFVSKLRIPTSMLRARYPQYRANAEWTTVLRSALMKPEHSTVVEALHALIEQYSEEMRQEHATA
jgi:glutamate/tyrosine decarboxylase-like PLP-dependent enzyme